MEKLKAWLIGERGRVTRLAKACGITHSAILQWKSVPTRHFPTIEKMTGIPRRELRPDIFKGKAA